MGLSKVQSRLNQSSPIAAWALLAIVVLSRIPFVLTHCAQEDAYISARAIHNLVTHGALEFNVGDRYSPVTSLAWGYVGAVPAAIVPRDELMLGFQALGVAFVGVAIVLLRKFLKSAWSAVALALCSPGLFASYLGMETGMCILYLALVAVAVAEPVRHRRLLYVLAGVGPLIRPELVVVSALVVALVWLAADLRLRDKLFMATAPALGALAYVKLNLLLSNELISPSVVAKSLSYQPEHSIRAFFDRLVMVFTSQFILPHFKVLPAWLNAAVNLAPLALLLHRLRDRTMLISADEGRVLTFVVFVAYGLPALFCYGGQFAQWYMFPPAFFAVFLALYCLPASLHEHAAIRALVLSALGMVALGQLALSYSTGVQEFRYRADVGRWIHGEAASNQTLLLEPAGYIPFYSDLRTYDDVGLVSPKVLAYIRSYGHQWWFHFVRDAWPDWIVDRHDFRVSAVTDSWYELSQREQQCLLASYDLARVFRYDPRNYAPNALALRVLQLGSHVDYYVYRLRPGTQTALHGNNACSN